MTSVLEPHSHACFSMPVTTLQDGAYSLPVLMLYVTFQLLIEFVRSNGLTETDWTQSVEMKHARDEIVALHDWWTKARPARKSPLEDVLVPDFMGSNDVREYNEYRKALEEDSKLLVLWECEDQSNLIRLIYVRQYL